VETLYQSEDTIRVVRLTSLAEVTRLRAVLERIAAELSWQPGDQLCAYQDTALHLAVRVGRELAGGLQVVMSVGGTGLSYRLVWPEVEATGTATAHVTMLALEKQYRGRPGLFGPLCVELWRCCTDRGIEQIVIEATPPTLRLYRRLHWGEECYLCAMGVREVADALAEKAERALSYRLLVDQAYRQLSANPSLIDLS
jgi:ribosomal protein S18 acetylase RimI-like enzyme